jgi:hypothetical protein
MLFEQIMKEGVFSEMAIYGQWIAWNCRSDHAGGDSVLE